MISYSWAIGVGGVLASGGATLLLTERGSSSAHRYWALGLVGLFPAWLVSFISLLQSANSPEAPLPPSALLSSSMALLGIIATEFLVRRLTNSRRSQSPWRFWLLGALAIMPGWAIALWFPF